MTIITMNMSDYKAEADDSIEAEYDNEILYVGWNPSLALQQQIQAEMNHPAAMPLDLVSADITQFLKKMYAYQR